MLILIPYYIEAQLNVLRLWSKQRSFVGCYKRAGGYIPERFMEHFFVILGSDYIGLIVWDNASLKTRFVVFGLALLYVRPNHVKDKPG